MTLPKHYYKGLSKKNTKEQLKELKKSSNLYKKGIYHKRKKMDSFKSKKSRHVLEFEKKYCVKISNLKDVSNVTGIPISALKKIIKKGMGAYYSGGSRPNQNAHSWAYARLASTLLKHNAYKVDKHIIDEVGGKIKPPLKKKCNLLKSQNKEKIENIIKCCKLTNLSEKKFKKCKRGDGVIFNLPRKYSKSKCAKVVRGYSMKVSCAPYKYC
jgi:hypothetical protein